MAYDVEAIRKKLKQSQAGKYTDPDEFKPDKAKDSTTAIKYRFYILPPLGMGDKLKSGEVNKEMDQFFIQHGNHWVNDRPHPCPRVWDGSDCPICQFGFDLLRDEKDEDRRRSVIKQWMPTTYQSVNIYFPHWKNNPEELRGKVKWYNAPKTLFDHWTACLMREDAGDPEEPEAYGVFFDESAAFLYQLEVLKQGKQNSYRTSHFLANGGKGAPMVKNEDGTPNEKGLATLLRLRHNLWEKLEEPDHAKIKKIFNVMVEGDDDDDEDGGFDSDETKKTESKPKQSKPAKADKPPKDDDEDVVDHLGPSDDDESVPDSGPSDDSLSAEGPLEDTPEPEASASDGGDEEGEEESSEITALLSQLEDDD
jgi:hypothetical protein